MASLGAWPRAVILLSSLFAAAAGCVPAPPNGAIRCNTSGGRECPEGYTCQVQSGTCWKSGQLPGGTLQKGQSCNSAEAGCQSGLTCADGVCCDRPCTGQCQSCSLTGQEGTCTNVTGGQPVGGRAACPGSGTACAGSCKGADACTYPPSGTVCGAACDGTCNGSGVCSSTAGGTCPGGFACGGSSCKTSCAQPEDCQPNFVCNAPSCVRVPESDCLDGQDNNGDTLIDCQDPSCTRVQCIAAPPSAEVGMFEPAGCPATDYTVVSAQHQNLQAQPCAGCSCTASLTCRTNLKGYSTSACNTAPLFTMILDATATAGPGACAAANPVASPKPPYLKFDAFSQVSSSCNTSGTPTAPTPTWGTDRSFCGAAKQSSSCAVGQICVPKPPASTKMCVRVPSAGASCPAGYGADQGTWYSSYTQAACACGSCSVTSGCPPGTPGVSFYGACNGAGAGYLYSDHTAGTECFSEPACPVGVSCENWNTFGGGRFTGPIAATCSNPTNTTTPATPTGASTICCQP